MIVRWLRRRRKREISEKLAALEELLMHLGDSEDSPYSGRSVAELIECVEMAKARLQAGDLGANKDLWALLVPTGPLQETAIDNGWGDQFLTIAMRLD